ncbi:hypothetical protein GCM10026987_32300 [Belliella aquatica]|uniref:Uncharacterized protein n=1 Tax=Belliella aquatica TaxID=1323734 RepID=A0ABQ1MHG7_9BACT|nr:hypothetical protein GCM10010993_19100 [Belliella aquatica]
MLIHSSTVLIAEFYISDKVGNLGPRHKTQDVEIVNNKLLNSKFKETYISTEFISVP